MEGVQVDSGGWMNLNNYCDSKPKGSQLWYTSEVCNEEIFECEVGIRVVVAMVQKAVDGWDALLDASYAEYCKGA